MTKRYRYVGKRKPLTAKQRRRLREYLNRAGMEKKQINWAVRHRLLKSDQVTRKIAEGSRFLFKYARDRWGHSDTEARRFVRDWLIQKAVKRGGATDEEDMFNLFRHLSP